jgi:hypothetical protein
VAYEESEPQTTYLVVEWVLPRCERPEKKHIGKMR